MILNHFLAFILLRRSFSLDKKAGFKQQIQVRKLFRNTIHFVCFTRVYSYLFNKSIETIVNVLL